jgi:hypothetical protein
MVALPAIEIFSKLSLLLDALTFGDPTPKHTYYNISTYFC